MSGKLILGLGGSSHDFSATLMDESNILCAIEDERVTRRKHGHTWWFEKPCLPSIEYCLNATGKSLNNIDSIATSDLSPKRLDSFLPNIVYYNHHLCHASSIYHLSNFSKMSLFICDGMGSKIGKKEGAEIRETISFYQCRNGNIECNGKTGGSSPIERDHFSRGISNSLGYFYNLITRLIGFGKNEEGKTMGLAAYGVPKYYPLMKEEIELGNCAKEAFVFNAFESNLVAILSNELIKYSYSFQVKANIAASAQSLFEKAMLNFATIAFDNGSSALGVAGGCSLNSVANRKLEAFAASRGKSFVIYPHVGDAGICFGAAFLELNKVTGKTSKIKIKGSENSKRVCRLGRHYNNEEVLEAFNHYYPLIDYEKCSDIETKIAALLHKGEVVAIFNGPSEFGPRALGGRSLLSNPTSAETRSNINNNIKFREPFRPIAPIILKEKFEEYFHGSNEQDFMLSVVKAKDKAINSVPSVIHVDDTARVQTITKDVDERLYNIVKEFEKLSGIPIICNTSFNQAGQPIVETPNEAISTFLNMPINYLFINNYLFFKSKK